MKIPFSMQGLVVLVALASGPFASHAAGIVPDGYEVIGGVRATDTQYIDTQYKVKSDSKFYFCFSIEPGGIAYAAPFGTYTAEATSCTRVIVNNLSTSGFLANHTSRANSCLGIADVNTAFGQRVSGSLTSTRCQLTGGRGVMKDGGQNIPRPSGAPADEKTFLLLKAKTNASAYKTDLYSFRIDETEGTVHEYIPVRRTSDQKVGFYDLVSEAFLIPENNATPLEVAAPAVQVEIAGQYPSAGLVSPSGSFPLNVGGRFHATSAPSATLDGTYHVCTGYILYTNATASATADCVWKTGSDLSLDVELPKDASAVKLEWQWIGGALPAGIRVAEHMTTDGNAYIQTDWVPTLSGEIRFHYAMSPSGYSGPFGAYTGEADNCTRIIANNNSKTDLMVHYMTKAGGGGVVMQKVTAQAMDEVEGTLNAKTATLNGKTASILTSQRLATPNNQALKIFRANNGGFAVRFWYLGIFENGAPVHYYLPCQRIATGEGVMLDLVTGNILENAGTGAFDVVAGFAVTAASNGDGGTVSVTQGAQDVNGIPVRGGDTVTLAAAPASGHEFVCWYGFGTDDPASPVQTVAVTRDVRAEAVFRRVNGGRDVPDGCVRLDYLMTTNAQCFDTGVYPCPGVSVDATVMLTNVLAANGRANLFGAIEDNYQFSSDVANGKDVQMDLCNFYSDRAYDRQGSSCSAPGTSQFFDETVALAADSGISALAFGGVTAGKGVVMSHYFTQATLALAGIGSARTVPAQCLPSNLFQMRIYDWKVKVDGVLVRDYLPCRKANGEVCLYDTISETFCEPIGGPVVDGGAWGGSEWNPMTTARFDDGGLFASYFTPNLTNFTANVWVENAKPGSGVWNHEAFGMIMMQGGFNSNPGFACYLAAATNAVETPSPTMLRFLTRWSGAEHTMSVDWPYVDDDMGHMVTVSYNATTRAKRIYVDGRLQAETTNPAEMTKPISDRNFCVGANETPTSFPLVGTVAEASVWNKALSEAEIKAMFANGLSGDEEGLCGFWSFSGARRMPWNEATPDCTKRYGVFYGTVTLDPGKMPRPARHGLLIFVK